MSAAPSQSSSWPSQISAGGTQLPQAQLLSQVFWPAEPQDVVQLSVAPAAQMKPLSAAPSQSSSRPLQLSAGGLQALQAQPLAQVLSPVEPQEVVQLPVAASTQAKPLSLLPSQSSSLPLQLSAGGMQLFQVQAAPQAPAPTVPQLVLQAPLLPAAHCQPQRLQASISWPRPKVLLGTGVPVFLASASSSALEATASLPVASM